MRKPRVRCMLGGMEIPLVRDERPTLRATLENELSDLRMEKVIDALGSATTG